MADAIVTLKLSPSEFKLVQTALEIARLESEVAAERFKGNAQMREMSQARADQVKFSDLLGKLS